MTSQQTQELQDRISALKGQPLRFVFRAMDLVCLEFGEVILKRVLGRDAAGRAALVEAEAGRYALHIQCFFRLTRAGEVVLARGDLFQPSAVLEQDAAFDSTAFDWSPTGNNHFDEVTAGDLSQPSDLVVADARVNRLGDLRLRFNGGFALEVLTDVSSDHECWRFFEAGSDDHLVVNGRGVETGEDAQMRSALKPALNEFS